MTDDSEGAGAGDSAPEEHSELLTALAESPLLKQLADVVGLLGRLSLDFAKRYETELAQLAKVGELLVERFPEWHRNAEANMRRLDEGLKLLKERNVPAADYAFSMYDAMEYAGLTDEEVEERLFQDTSSPNFENEILESYRRSGLPEERLPLLSEFILLHRNRHFAGAILLGLAQIEGIITDGLARGGHVSLADGSASTPRGRLNGLHAKLGLADENAGGQTDAFQSLLRSTLAETASGLSFSHARNRIVHGADVAYATRAHSSRLALWVLAVLAEVRMLRDKRDALTS